jgi:hypothetical protein
MEGLSGSVIVFSWKMKLIKWNSIPFYHLFIICFLFYFIECFVFFFPTENCGYGGPRDEWDQYWEWVCWGWSQGLNKLIFHCRHRTSSAESESGKRPVYLLFILAEKLLERSIIFVLLVIYFD